ncbi:hypothetical protein CR513_17257, partial [Mucuna pruriens]
MVNNVHFGIDKVRRKLPPITFINQDFVGVDPEQNNPTVITIEVANFTVKKRMTWQRYVESLKVVTTGTSARKKENIMANVEMDLQPLVEQGPEPIEKLQHIQLIDDVQKNTQIGKRMKGLHHEQLVLALRKNMDLFTWKPFDMPGIDPNFLCHHLALCAEAKPVAKTRGERRVAMERETTKLREEGFIREVDYTTWLPNIVLVKKSNGKWRMCAYYTDLNKVCSKDSYPLLNIDRLVNRASDF